MDDPGEDVAADGVGAEPVRATRRLHRGAGRERGLGGDQGRENGDQAEQEEEGEDDLAGDRQVANRAEAGAGRALEAAGESGTQHQMLLIRGLTMT